LKTECLNQYKFKTGSDEKMSFEYIEVFYSHILRHANIDNQIATNFAQAWLTQQHKNAA